MISCTIKEFGRWIDYNKKFFRRYIYLPNSAVNFIRANTNNEGIFETVYSYSSTEQDEALKYGDFYLDFDSDNNEKGFELVREDALKAISYFKIVFNIKVSEMKIYYSGNKGIHLIIPAPKIGASADVKLNLYYKTLAEKVSDYISNGTLDLQIYDTKRLFRIPNSRHEKTGRHKILITINELREKSYDEIILMASEPRFNVAIDNVSSSYIDENAKKLFESIKEETNEKLNKLNVINGDRKYKFRPKYMPPCIQNLLINGAKAGERNNSTAILASYYKINNFDSKVATESILLWNEEINSNPLKESEIKRTINSIYSGNKTFGCSKIKSLGFCNETCKLLNRK